MAYSVPATILLDKPILQGLDASSASAVHEIGYKVCAETGQEFMYVKTSASTLSANAGYPAYWYINTTDPYTVTSDYSDSSIESSGFGGVFTCTVSAAATAHYVWIQTKGEAADCAVSTACAACDELVAVADYELSTQIVGEPSYGVVAIALEADTNAVADILIL